MGHNDLYLNSEIKLTKVTLILNKPPMIRLWTWSLTATNTFLTQRNSERDRENCLNVSSYVLPRTSLDFAFCYINLDMLKLESTIGYNLVIQSNAFWRDFCFK